VKKVFLVPKEMLCFEKRSISNKIQCEEEASNIEKRDDLKIKNKLLVSCEYVILMMLI
jgi:hypothetical protein